MNTFDPNQHPRGDAGRFTDKTHGEAGVALDGGQATRPRSGMWEDRAAAAFLDKHPDIAERDPSGCGDDAEDPLDGEVAKFACVRKVLDQADDDGEFGGSHSNDPANTDDPADVVEDHLAWDAFTGYLDDLNEVTPTGQRLRPRDFGWRRGSDLVDAWESRCLFALDYR